MTLLIFVMPNHSEFMQIYEFVPIESMEVDVELCPPRQVTFPPTHRIPSAALGIVRK